MKTSSTQFLIMLKCMEKNGDLNKPGEGPYGRLKQHEKWTELIEALNTDITGERKSLEKWKKVWSDLKNNTKRKAAKIQNSVTGTGRGSISTLVLTDLELRVLNVLGIQPATGLIEVEAADSESPRSAPVSNTSVDTKPDLSMIYIENSPSSNDNMEYLLSPEIEVEGCSDPVSPEAERDNTRSPPSSRRRRPFRQRSTPRRSAHRRVDSATRRFLASDERWRNLFSELATEHLRLREREIETQAQWQALFSRCINCVESFLN